MKILSRIALLLATAALAACATMPEMEYSHRVNFASYHDFYWQPVKHQTPLTNPILDSQILGQRVRAATVETLTGQGYEQVDNADQADFIVTYQTATQEHIRSRDGMRFGFGIGYPFYFGPYWNPFFSGAYYPARPYGGIESYHEGYLVIDVIDAQSGDLAWRGWDTATIKPANFSRKAVAGMVERILSRFPPP